MQVTEINAQGSATPGLKREFQVLLAAQELEERLTSELSGMKDKVQLKGRKGQLISSMWILPSCTASTELAISISLRAATSGSA